MKASAEQLSKAPQTLGESFKGDVNNEQSHSPLLISANKPRGGDRKYLNNRLWQ